MFIYVLGAYNTMREEELGECFEIVTTDIQKILDYLSLDRMSYERMTDYSIIIKIDGDIHYSQIFVSKNTE